MIGPLAVEDVVFVMALAVIAAACRVALRRADDAMGSCDPARTHQRPSERGNQW